jgi:hypothetical protein
MRGRARRHPHLPHWVVPMLTRYGGKAVEGVSPELHLEGKRWAETMEKDRINGDGLAKLDFLVLPSRLDSMYHFIIIMICRARPTGSRNLPVIAVASKRRAEEEAGRTWSAASKWWVGRRCGCRQPLQMLSITLCPCATSSECLVQSRDWQNTPHLDGETLTRRLADTARWRKQCRRTST